jgi:hypothetical protein
MKKYFYCFLVLVLFGCSSGKVEEKWHPTFRVQGGLNNGGIVENTDFGKTPEIQPDAFSGATKTGFNFGGHVLLPVLGNSVESGLDYMYSNQTFTYKDLRLGFKGDRKINTSQIMLPVTYNFGFFNEEQPLGALQLKFGFALQFNFFSIDDGGASLTSYDLKHFSSGFTFGIATTPFKLPGGALIGFYVDGYRGTKMFDDLYNQSIYDKTGSSYVKFGAIFQF